MSGYLKGLTAATIHMYTMMSRRANLEASQAYEEAYQRALRNFIPPFEMPPFSREGAPWVRRRLDCLTAERQRIAKQLGVAEGNNTTSPINTTGAPFLVGVET